MVRSHRLLLFEDFSTEVAKIRWAFSEICSSLFKQKVRIQQQYPASMQGFLPEGTTKTFVTPSDSQRELAEFLDVQMLGIALALFW